MTHSDEALIKLLRQGWRGETASDLMVEAADRIDALKVMLAHRTAQLDRLTSADLVQGDAKLRENSGDADATENHNELEERMMCNAQSPEGQQCIREFPQTHAEHAAEDGEMWTS